MTSGTQCIFCAILSGQAEASVIFEDADSTAFLEINPLVPGHTPVIPPTNTRQVLDQSARLLHKALEGEELAENHREQ